MILMTDQLTVIIITHF